jgi:hypothetical protein
MATTTLSVRPGPTRIHAILSCALVALVLVQATLAGQSLFGSADIAIHGYVGNASFLAGLVIAVLAFVARMPGWAFAAGVATLCLLFAQTGLGYVGRESAAAASWHLPLGVAIFGLATLQAAGSVSLVRRPT